MATQDQTHAHSLITFTNISGKLFLTHTFISNFSRFFCISPHAKNSNLFLYFCVNYFHTNLFLKVILVNKFIIILTVLLITHVIYKLITNILLDFLKLINYLSEF